MTSHDQMAALTLKKGMPIERKKVAGMVSPLIRKKRAVAGVRYPSSGRLFEIGGQRDRVV
jgi:hypothetical protein